MQILHGILFVFSLLGLLDIVAAVPPFTQEGVIRVVDTGATIGLMSYLSIKYFNSPQWAEEKQAPEVPAVEIHEDVYPTASIAPLPTPTFGSADNTTQEEPLPLSTEEPCIFNSVFAADPSDVIIPYRGAPPMVKLTNLTAACNGTVIEIYEFVTVLVADIPKFFQHSDIVDADKKPALPAAAESVFPNISLGVNLPEPEPTALNKPSAFWHLAEVFQNAYQNIKFRPFVELARRKVYLFGSLLGKILGPLLFLLPRESSPMPMILISVSAISGTWSRTRRQRRQLVIRYAPLIARWEWLQYLVEMFVKGGDAVGRVVDKTLEGGPQAQQSVALSPTEVQTVFETIRTLISIIERPPVTSGYQDDDQGDDDHDGNGSFVDTFEFPSQLQSGMPSDTNTDDLVPTKYYVGGSLRGNPDRLSGFLTKAMPPPSTVNTDVTEAPASSDTSPADIPLPVSPVKCEYPAQFRSRSPSPSKSSSERSPPPPKLPHFTQTRSTNPIAEKARRLPFMSAQKDDDWMPMPTDASGRVRLNRPGRIPVVKTKKFVRPVPIHESKHEDEDEANLLGYIEPAKIMVEDLVKGKNGEVVLVSTPSSSEQTASEDVSQVEPPVSSISILEKPADTVATSTISEVSEVISPIKEQSEDVPSEDLNLPSTELEQQDGAGVDAEPELDRQPFDSVYGLVDGPFSSLQTEFDDACTQQPVRETRRPPPLKIIEDSPQKPTQLQIKEPVDYSSLLHEEPTRPSIPFGIPGLDNERELPDSPLKNKGKGKSRARHSVSRKAQPGLASEPPLAEAIDLFGPDFNMALALAQNHEDNSNRPPLSKPDMTDPPKWTDYIEQVLGERHFASDSGPHAELSEASSSKQHSTDLPSTDPQPAAANEQSSAPNQTSNVSSTQSEEKTTGKANEQPPTINSSNAASAEPDRSDPVWQDNAVKHLLGLIREKFAKENADSAMLRYYLYNRGWETLTDGNADLVCKQFLDAVAEYETQEAAKGTGAPSIVVDSEPTSSEADDPPVAPEVLPTSNEQVEGDESQKDGEKKTPKPEENAPPVPQVDDDDDDEDGSNGPPPPSSGAIMEEVALVEKPAEENSNNSAVNGNDNDSHRRSILRTPGAAAIPCCQILVKSSVESDLQRTSMGPLPPIRTVSVSAMHLL